VLAEWFGCRFESVAETAELVSPGLSLHCSNTLRILWITLGYHEKKFQVHWKQTKHIGKISSALETYQAHCVQLLIVRGSSLGFTGDPRIFSSLVLIRPAEEITSAERNDEEQRPPHGPSDDPCHVLIEE